MRRVTAEMPSRAQHSGIGTLSTTPAGGVGATAGGGAVRMTPAGGALDGTGPVSRTVAFIRVSGVGAMRAVSLRGALEALRFSIGAATGLTGGGGAIEGVGKDMGGLMGT